MCLKRFAGVVALCDHRAVLKDLLTLQATLSSSTLHRVFLNRGTFNSNIPLSRTMDLSLCTNKESHQQEQTTMLPV